MTLALLLWRWVEPLLSRLGKILHAVPKAIWDHAAAFATAALIGWMLCYIHYDVKGLRAAAANWDQAERQAFAIKDAEIARLKKQIVSQRAADDAVTAKLDAVSTQARADRLKVLSVLKREPAYDKNSHCLFDGDARRLLDIAAGAIDGNTALPDPATTGNPAARGPEAAGPATLSCEQLVTGYLNLGEYARNTRALAIAWQDWFRKTLAESN